MPYKCTKSSMDHSNPYFFQDRSNSPGPAELKHVKSQKKRRPATDPPWTTSRCNRVLRSISSRLLILHKAGRMNATSVAGSDFQHGVTRGDDSPPSSSCSASTPDSPEWLQKTRKIAKATYGRSQRVYVAPPRNVSTSFSFPTPLLKKMLRPHAYSPSTLQDPTLISPSFKCGAARKSMQLPIIPKSDVEEALRNLLTAFEAFLKSTKPVTEGSRKGSHTLLEMCLNAMPHYLKIEQAVCTQTEEISNEAPGRVLDLSAELEGYFETKTGAGWPGLRRMVRSSGLRMIEDAIMDHTIPESIIPSLLDLCLRNTADDGHKVIVKAALNLGAGCVMSRCYQLMDHGLRQGMRCFWLRNISALLLQRQLSVMELTKCALLWQIFAEVLHSSDRSVALDFLHTFVEAVQSTATKSQHSACLKRLVNAFVMLTAWVIAPGMSENEQGIVETVNWIHGVIPAINGMEIQVNGSVEIRKVLAMASLVLETTGFSPGQQVYSFGRNTRLFEGTDCDCSGDKFSTTAVEQFLSRLVRLMECMEAGSGVRMVHRIAATLVEFSPNDNGKSDPKELDKIVLRCLQVHAETTGNETCLQFPNQAPAVRTTHVFSTPQPHKTRYLYRFEEGLREWVNATPRDTMIGTQTIAAHRRKAMNVTKRSRAGSKPQTHALVRRELCETELTGAAVARDSRRVGQIEVTSISLGQRTSEMSRPPLSVLNTAAVNASLIPKKEVACSLPTLEDDDELLLRSPKRRKVTSGPRKISETGMSRSTYAGARFLNEIKQSVYWSRYESSSDYNSSHWHRGDGDSDDELANQKF